MRATSEMEVKVTNKIAIYGDIVLNHLAGADGTERVRAATVPNSNRNALSSGFQDLTLFTRFSFPGRAGTYSTFQFNSTHFNAVGCSVSFNPDTICKLEGRNWNFEVDQEFGNFDFLIGSNLDWDNPAVVNEMQRWGLWLTNTLSLDGVRLDAVKHVKFTATRDWLDSIRRATGKEYFAVGEYLSGDINALDNYLQKTNYRMSLFDFPLHFRLRTAATSFGNFDLRTIFDGTLVQRHRFNAVTFVDNHDTQLGRPGSSWIPDWFKPSAYALIMTREAGYPTLFYGDYYGIPAQRVNSLRSKIDPIMKARKYAAYGPQYDYFDDADLIGWTREGLPTHDFSGMAALVTDRNGGSKWMFVGQQHAGEVWVDATGGIQDRVTINGDGWGQFRVGPGSMSLWVNSRLRDAWNEPVGSLVNVTFNIEHVDLPADERIFVVGSTPNLGSLKAGGEVSTVEITPTRSRLTVQIPYGTALEFKALKKNLTTGQVIKYNEGQNQRFNVSDLRDSEVYVLWKNERDFVE